MKVIIHRGAHQIGGCITEVQSDNGTKIIIDIGENLPSANHGDGFKADVSIDSSEPR